jgi:hypothetical protein
MAKFVAIFLKTYQSTHFITFQVYGALFKLGILTSLVTRYGIKVYNMSVFFHVTLLICKEPWFLDLRTNDCQVHPGYMIFSSLDNVYIKLFVHETGLQVRFLTFALLTSVGVYTLRQCFGSRINLIRIRIQHFRLNIDSDPDPIRIHGSGGQKVEKNLQLKKIEFFWVKNYNLLSLGLHKGRPSYRGSLQPSTESIQHFKT